MSTLSFHGLTFEIGSTVYKPAEDTFFLLTTLLEYIPKTFPLLSFPFLEMGAGSGLITLTLLEQFPLTTAVAVDINPKAIQCIQKNCKQNHILDKRLSLYLSDLFSVVNPTQLFPLIIFNPPYVPSFAKELELFDDARNWAGGSLGREIIDKFAQQALKYLSNDGKVILLTSSHNSNLAKDLSTNYHIKELARKNLTDEILICYELSRMDH